MNCRVAIHILMPNLINVMRDNTILRRKLERKKKQRRRVEDRENKQRRKVTGENKEAIGKRRKEGENDKQTVDQILNSSKAAKLGLNRQGTKL